MWAPIITSVPVSNGDLVSFVKGFRSKRGSGPNLMQMAAHDMPAGAGRKNGKVRSKES